MDLLPLILIRVRPDRRGCAPTTPVESFGNETICYGDLPGVRRGTGAKQGAAMECVD